MASKAELSLIKLKKTATLSVSNKIFLIIKQIGYQDYCSFTVTVLSYMFFVI